MATLRISSEYEPLIGRTHVTNDEIPISKLIRPYRVKPILFVIALLIITAIIICAIPHKNTNTNIQWIRMEKQHPHKNHIPSPWSLKEECDDEHLFTITLALKQQNTDELESLIAQVSDPSNTDTFHQYWTPEEVRSYFKPTDKAVNSVLEWLETNGFTKENGKVNIIGPYGNIIKVKVTCSEANDLLNTNYMFYQNKEDDSTHLRVQDGIYNIPASVYSHIDFITPTIRFPLRHHTLTIETMSDRAFISMKSPKTPKKIDDIDEDIVYNTPEQLSALYQMTDSVAAILGNEADLDTSSCRQSILSLIEQYYDDNDLETFWETFNVLLQSEMQRVPETQPDGYGAEAELDTQYITSMGTGIYTYVFYMDLQRDPFLGLIEAILAASVPPLVVSMSYGADEYSLGEEYATRANQEFGKLALIGTTLLASSGDSGVRGDDSDCYEGVKFVASFPASAPYVTAVGGTKGGQITSSIDDSTQETAWKFSGGGFSEYFDAPQWQRKAVKSYFDNDNIEFPDESQYDATKRGYPDISAQAVNYIIDLHDIFYVVSGTSASSPSVAGMISLINYARIQDGKPSLGFLNPVLYKLYDKQKDDFNYYFNDVVKGSNLGCIADDDIGFYAAKGWDPVTGTGTPKFERLYQELLLNID